MYKKVKTNIPTTLENIHAEEWHYYYRNLVMSKAINGETKSKTIRKHYNKFCLDHLTKFIDLVK